MSDKENKISQDEVAEDKIVVDFDANSESEDAGSGANDELVDALREKDQLKRLAQRAQADLVNYRRRIEGEQESSRLRNQQRIVLKFADVIDQLDVALKTEGAESADSSWFEGVEAIYKNFVSALASEGFEKFECVGEEFDPRKHEALLSSPSADHEPNTVITELRPGYIKNDEVVRPAQVQIAVALPDASEGDNEG